MQNTFKAMHETANLLLDGKECVKKTAVVLVRYKNVLFLGGWGARQESF